MQTTLITEILALLLGRKYYANIVAVNGTDKTDICSHIFATKQQAEQHKQHIATTLSFQFIETISFRSRKNYIQQ